ncbi:hypothetical protein EYF80_058164 [Liparis tanakae]|uniref:Uncharacterized protein n=1 Tax=Liparis tanakae TaxID=230148 RepID=A0A4Z2ERY5_9TELE|nr:hypothetical protein EYF80_058164 [Liparis tanakae]
MKTFPVHRGSSSSFFKALWKKGVIFFFPGRKVYRFHLSPVPSRVEEGTASTQRGLITAASQGEGKMREEEEPDSSPRYGLLPRSSASFKHNVVSSGAGRRERLLLSLALLERH